MLDWGKKFNWLHLVEIASLQVNETLLMVEGGIPIAASVQMIRSIF